MTGNAIRFGTSGWRAIIADQFTFANVRLAAAAIAGHVLSRNPAATLIVGCDTRFLSDQFARASAEVLAAHGIRVLLCARPTPTPAIAFEVLRRKVDGAVNITASHNPAEYNGVKFSGPHGGPALPEETKDIESRAAKLATPEPARKPKRAGAIEPLDASEAYRKRLADIVGLAAIRKAKLRFVCDVLHGCGAGYLDRVLADAGADLTTLNAARDVLFDGSGPDPSEEKLAPLGRMVCERKAAAGLATDGDADRFGIVDADGTFAQPNHILAMLLDYLAETRGWKQGAARSVATSHLMDAVAKLHGMPVHETPVGFKYIGELVRADKIALGGEESSGVTIRGHVPEKDGILACLLVAEMIAARRASLAQQLQALFRRVGREYWPMRVNLRLPEDVQARLLERLRGTFAEFAGKRVARADRTDGTKLVFDDGAWVLLRLSGTEPLVRIYVETQSPKQSDALARSAQKWIFS